MRNYLFLVLIVLSFSCQTKHEAQSPLFDTDSLTSHLQTIAERGNLHGFAVSVADEDALLYKSAFGYANTQEKKAYTLTTKQQIGSISKTMVGLALLKAQELGQLHLDDPINKYLPFSIKNPNYPEVGITIRHLANHTSSIINTDHFDDNSYYLRNNKHQAATTPIKVFDYFNPVEPVVPIAEFMKYMYYTEEGVCCRETFSEEEPGATFSYSNGGCTLAAAVLEFATGMSFTDFTKEHILDPLSMSSTSWNADDIEATLYHNHDTVYAEYLNRDYPAGGLITNTEDLSRYLQELIKGYNGKGTLLSNESYAALFNKELVEQRAKEPFAEGEGLLTQIKYDKGIFMGIAPMGFVGHTGGDPGVVTLMFFNSKTGRGYTFILNRSVIFEFEDALNDLMEVLDLLEGIITKEQAASKG